MAATAVGPVRPENPDDADAHGRPQSQRGSGDAAPTAGLAGAAGLIAALTTAARLVGFVRFFVFAALIGITDLGSLYQSVNTLPNVAFEIVAGGALAMVVVPLLSAALARGDVDGVSRMSSALLTWTVAILMPLSVLVAVLAGPIVGALLSFGDRAATSGEIEVGTRMLYVFAPQLVLYGVGIVLTGVLQAHRRFAGPALAPLLSSLTVMSAYVAFWVLAGSKAGIDGLSLGEELVLSVGTTAGVAVLSLCLLVPLRATGVRLRPTFAFPPGVARTLRGLVGGGVAAVAGQQAALLVAVVLCQPTKSFQQYGLAQTMFLLPWAVLAVPVATSAFPRLSAAHEKGDPGAFRAVLATSTRTVLLLCAVGTALLVAAAEPLGQLIALIGHEPPTGAKAAAVAGGIAAFAPGLLGYGLLALVSRALYAAGAGRTAAAATVAGWLVVIAADVTLAALVPDEHRVAALAGGHSIGMCVLGIALVLLLRARVGSVPGLGRAVVAALALVVTASAGGIAAGELPAFGPDIAGSVAQGMLVGVVVAIVAALVAAAAYPRSARSAGNRARSRGTAGD